MERLLQDRNEWMNRAAILKLYEDHCYQVCYFMLCCEDKAMQATCTSMECLFQDAAFFDKTEEERIQVIRKTAARFSLKCMIPKDEKTARSH